LLAARLVVLVLRRWRTGRSGLTGAAYLAGRRLAGAPGVAAVLVVAAALSIGVLTFATAMTGTLRYSVDTKARIFVGSDAQITLMAPLRELPPALRGSATSVVTTSADVPRIGHVDILGVDPATFASAAAWDDRLGGSLDGLMHVLRGPAGPSGPPAIAVGDLPDRFALPLVELGGKVAHLPVRVAARPAAFAQQHGDALVVVPASAIPAGARQLAANELWVKGWDDEKQAALRAAGARIRFVTTVADVSRAPDLAAVTWTYGFFESLGALTGVIAIGGLLLYLATRQRSRALAYGLTRRMGLRRAAHALSVLLEVGAGLLAGYVVGTALGTLGVWAVYGHLDPEADLPPDPLLHLPVSAYVALALATAVVAVAATALAQHTADRTRTADLLRLGTA
jgi:putative ABC transport system permease protein